MASLANTLSVSKGLLTRPIPSKAITFRSATFPAGMMFSPTKFRLPFCHTSPITKDLFAVKVAGRAGNIFTTPFAFLGDFVCRSTSFIPAIMIAPKRAIDFIKAEVTIKGFTAGWAYLCDCVNFILISWHTYFILCLLGL